MTKKQTIVVKGSEIAIIQAYNTDYISLTDMIKSFGDETIIYNWLRNRNTVEFLGIWEQIYNPDFKPIEFDRFKIQSGLNSFTLSPKNGLMLQMRSALFPKPEDMVAALLLIKTSLLNLVHG